ncbi:MAG: hypothetical protein NC342_09200 [Pseudoflavonifractor sp.]|nr:hypothetical protein [Alloprevotella sp.]MCM1117696.1 hypothetical protein [Pseudoflavonifractor sp.]
MADTTTPTKLLSLDVFNKGVAYLWTKIKGFFLDSENLIKATLLPLADGGGLAIENGKLKANIPTISIASETEVKSEIDKIFASAV